MRTEAFETKLSPTERAGTFTLAVVSLLAGLGLALAPVYRATTTIGEKGSMTSIVSSPAEYTELSVLFVAAGILLFAWGFNGLRLTRVAWGDVVAQVGQSPEAAAAKAVASEPKVEEQVVDLAKSDAGETDTQPISAASSKGEVVLKDETELVYSLEAVPFFVISDLLAAWPEGLEKPDDLGEFEFAARAKGKGNKPWRIKFQGLPMIKVSYGGRSKTGATTGAMDG